MVDEVVVYVSEPEVLVVEVGQPGPPGKDGFGTLSADPNNRATLDAEGGLLVPDLSVDPLAYYILARS